VVRAVLVADDDDDDAVVGDRRRIVRARRRPGSALDSSGERFSVQFRQIALMAAAAP
jgi:hypothetical protein